MSRSLVSVVIPTYNRAHIVAKAIASALAQDYQATEVVVVDDGSTDDTEARIKDDFAGDPRVRYVRKANGGPAGARNVGFAHARGEYVALLDSDDTWHPWKLGVQVRCMERYPDLGMTWTDMEMIDPSGRVADPAHLRKMYSAYKLFSDDQIFSEAIPLREIAPEQAATLGAARSGRRFRRVAAPHRRGLRLSPANLPRRSRRSARSGRHPLSARDARP